MVCEGLVRWCLERKLGVEARPCVVSQVVWLARRSGKPGGVVSQEVW